METHADYDERITELRSRVERLANVGSQPGASPIWSEVLAMQSYLKDLSPKSLKAVRYHAGLITGANVLRYWHPYPAVDAVSEVRKLGYDQLINGLPDRLWATDIIIPQIQRSLGVDYKGKIVNETIARFQNCISALYHSGAVDFIEQSGAREIIVEIGAGHGGLAHCLHEGIATPTCYLIVDLPEMLMMSGAFLIANNPGKSIWVYDEDAADGSQFEEAVLQHDFVLIPHFAAHRILELKKVALFINLLSFQEMTEAQVAGYLDIIQATATFGLFSENLDCHPYNSDLTSITKMLAARFDLTPNPSLYDRMFKSIDPRNSIATRKYIAQKASASTKCRPLPSCVVEPKDLKLLLLLQRLSPLKEAVRNAVHFLWRLRGRVARPH